MPSITVPGASSAPELDAHLAVPPVGEGPWPGVVVLHEAFGLTVDIKQQADRLPAPGYLAGAPALYAAGGGEPVRLLLDVDGQPGRLVEDDDAGPRPLADRRHREVGIQLRGARRAGHGDRRHGDSSGSGGVGRGARAWDESTRSG